MEAADLELIAAVRAAVDHPARGQAQPVLLGAGQLRRARPSAAGADGLVLFNRFYQPDLDLETLEVVAARRAEPAVGAAPAAALDRDPAAAARRRRRRSRRPPASTPGTDVVKALMVGADVAMMTSALLRHGPEHVAHGRGGAARLDGRARVRVGRRSCAAAPARPRRRTRPRSSGPTTCRRCTPGRRRGN